MEIVFQEEVPLVSKYNLECLTGIDVYLWHEVWPERQKREYLDTKLNIWLGAVGRDWGAPAPRVS